jgi:hypothetical protein
MKTKKRDVAHVLRVPTDIRDRIPVIDRGGPARWKTAAWRTSPACR